jgi:hypothetical protein
MPDRAEVGRALKAFVLGALLGGLLALVFGKRSDQA